MALSYHLEDAHVRVTYVDSNIAGKKQLVIAQKGIAGVVHSFDDKEITFTHAPFADAATVTLKKTIDSGNQLFTLFLPKFEGGFRARAISTVAMLTTNRGPVAAPQLASKTYEALELSGVVEAIDT